MPLRAEEAGGVADPAAGPPAGTDTTGLWDSARTLAESQFRVLWLRYGEDMEVAEIARAVGKSRVAVSLLLHRARTNLMKRTGAAPAGAMAAAKPAAAGGPTAG